MKYVMEGLCTTHSVWESWTSSGSPTPSPGGGHTIAAGTISATARDDGAGGGGTDGLTPTAVKTAGYVATYGDLVEYDATATDGFTIELPTAVGHDNARVGAHNASDSRVPVTLSADDSIDDLGSVVLVEPRATLVLRAKNGVWHTDYRYAPRVETIPITLDMQSTNALTGARQELGGVFVHVEKFGWAKTATLRVYLRTTDGAQLAHAELYDSDGAVHLAPSSLGAVSAWSTTGVEQEVDVSDLLTVAGGSGFGWLQLRAWSDGGGASAIVGRADLILT